MHGLYNRLVEWSFFYRYLIPSGRGRGRLLKMLRRFEPADLQPGLVTRDGKQWFLSDMRNNAEEAIYYGLPYDPETAELIAASVKPGDYVIDVGANIGIFTSQLAHRVGPSGRVFAFEASPVHFQTVKRNIELQGLSQVKLNNFALADKESVAMHFTTRSSGSLVSDYSQFGMELRETNQVQTRRLDDVLSDEEARRVTFMKIDVDGNEIDVLRGSENVLRLSHARLLVEVSERAQELAGTTALALLEIISSFGYWFQIANEAPIADVRKTLDRVNSQPVFCDVLCIHSDELNKR
jgi:FkbM family methyltransferase